MKKTACLFQTPLTADQARRLKLSTARPPRPATIRSFIKLVEHFWQRPLAWGLSYLAVCTGLMALTKYLNL